MKTVKEWFELIKDPVIREKALKALKHSNQKVVSMEKAIRGGFSWSDTPEGIDYWSNIIDELVKNPNYLQEEFLDTSGVKIGDTVEILNNGFTISGGTESGKTYKVTNILRKGEYLGAIRLGYDLGLVLDNKHLVAWDSKYQKGNYLKVITPKENEIFKDGDWVICIENSKDTYKGLTWVKDKLFQIGSFHHKLDDGNCNYHVYPSGCLFSDWIRRATPEEVEAHLNSNTTITYDTPSYISITTSTDAPVSNSNTPIQTSPKRKQKVLVTIINETPIIIKPKQKQKFNF